MLKYIIESNLLYNLNYAGGKNMANVFVNAEAMQVQLANGRKVSLGYLIEDYERLLEKESPQMEIISESKESMLKVGEWFLINRDVIDENEEVIRQKCYNAGRTGATLHKRFEKSNKIANENPDKYPRLIQTYIFIHMWECKKNTRDARYLYKIDKRG